MPRRSPFGRRLPLGTLAALLLSAACKDAIEPTSGALRASVVTTGGDLDLDGYAVVVDTHPSRPIGVNQVVVIPGLPTGVHDVQLTGVAQNCTLAGQNPRSVSVIAADTVEVAFTVTCGATTGAIQISASTSGLDPDSNGYTVQLDGGAPRALAANGLVTITGVTGGDHVVSLAGAEANCTPAGSNPRTVQVTTGGTTRDTARTTFQVTCVATTGVIEVTTVTSGADLDPNGYYIEVDTNSGPRSTIAANGTVHFTGVSGGSHQVQLGVSYVSWNCTLSGENPRTLSVTTGSVTRDTVRTTFEITCAALGSIEVTTRTTGLDLDPNGYGIYARPIVPTTFASVDVPANGTVTIPGLVAGDYIVDLGGVTMNCDVVGPNWSTVSVPSGGTASVAFDVTCAQAAQLAVSLTVNGNTDIYTLKSNGAGLTRLTTDPALDLGPVWSPDGTRIAFWSNRDGGVIYVMNADGSGVIRLTTNTVYDSWPEWSPDGTKIVFTSQRDANDENNEDEIYVMNADGTNPVRLTNHPAEDAFPAWSPDGSKIAFMSRRDGNGEIYVMNPDGSGVTRLTTNTVQDLWPAWSPDGAKLVFSRAVSYSDLYVMNADGSGAAQLTYDSRNDHAAWSPDGGWIAFGACPDRCRYGYGAVHVVRTDGSRVVELLRDALYPAWKP